uniref:CCHC-type domain-containing protein n=1 Tax=Tanacetum cinerariifolium TaxID=118510 RepID=A0A6L2L565_TANCI|nr:hypothetical protein [Tanacetum cinerariifolium]
MKPWGVGGLKDYAKDFSSSLGDCDYFLHAWNSEADESFLKLRMQEVDDDDDGRLNFDLRLHDDLKVTTAQAYISAVKLNLVLFITQTTTTENGAITTTISSPVTAEEKIKKKNDVKARSMLLMALLNEHLMTFNQYKDAKSLFAAIEIRFGVWRNKSDLDTMSIDDLYNNFKIVEQKLALFSMKAKSFFHKTGKKITINGSNTAGFDKSKVECYNCHKIGYFARECRDLRNQDSRNRYQDSYRRIVHVEETPPKAMVAIDGVGSQIPNNSKKGLCYESYHAVPPPPTGLFLPPKLDFSNSGLEEFQQPKFKGLGPKTSKSVCEDISNEFKEYPDAPLVKDRVSDNKDCLVESLVMVERKSDVPTVAKIDFVRAKQENPFRKPVRNMAPRVVLIKTSLRPLNTARPVNTAHPKTTLYYARPMLRFSKSAQSTIKRPYQQRTTLTNISFRETVNTARLRPVNTARTRPVNTARPNLAIVNAVRVNQAYTYYCQLKINATKYKFTTAGDEKPSESEGFEQIINFLNANPIKYVLTVNPTIYTLCIKEFWATAKVKTVNREEQIHALVDKKKVIITETSVRSDLRLKDVEVYLNSQVEGMLKHKEIYVTLSHTKKIFANMKRQGKDFSCKVTLLFETMMVHPQEDMGEDSDIPTDSHHTPTVTQPSTSSQPQQKQKSKKPKKRSLSLKRRMKKLEKKTSKKTHKLKRLYKIGFSTRVESFEDSGLGDQKDASKQGRMIDDLNANEGVTLVDETQGRSDQDVTPLFVKKTIFVDEEVVSEKEVSTVDPVPIVGEVVTSPGVEVVTTARVEVSTAARTSQIYMNEITLTKALTDIKTSKPKTRGIVMQEPSETPTPTPIDSSQQSSKAKYKCKAKMTEPKKPLKRKDQIMIDEEVARNLKAWMQDELEEEKRLAR